MPQISMYVNDKPIAADDGRRICPECGREMIVVDGQQSCGCGSDESAACGCGGACGCGH